MSDGIKHAAAVVNHAVAHSPVMGWWVVFVTYVQLNWLEWGSIAADIISWAVGTLLTIVLLANHSITLYRSIKKGDTNDK